MSLTGLEKATRITENKSVGITSSWAFLLGVVYSAFSLVVSGKAPRQQSSRNTVYICGATSHYEKHNQFNAFYSTVHSHFQHNPET